ncbi:hypothetical protein [Demequina aestuarii]|uniref:hypothetical protein n=1 Tax=Demequina aestuarii TaxID=327095 RepID=UPI00128B8602|nr:hypothetical protein [Demequina aestuarii]
MTPAHSLPLSLAVRRVRTVLVALVVLSMGATLAACSAAADVEPTHADALPVDSTGDSPDPQPVESAGVEATDEVPDAGGYTSDDVGDATLRVNGVEFPDFTGDCEISREAGSKDVGDLTEGDIQVIVGIDNVVAQEGQDEAFMNYTAINEESFRFGDLAGVSGVDTPARGEITTIKELGPRTAEGSRDIVEVRFSGVVEDGTTLEADVVCELQNAF